MVNEAVLNEVEAEQSFSATERSMASLWKEVLQSDAPLNANDDFFALGGDSMSMVVLEFRIQEELSVTLRAGAVLEAPTLRELSALVDTARDS